MNTSLTLMASLAWLLAATPPRPDNCSTSPTGMFPLIAGAWLAPHRKLWRTQVALTVLRNFWMNLNGTPVQPSLGRKNPKGILHHQPSLGQTIIEGPVPPGNGLMRFFLSGKASSATKTCGWGPRWSDPGSGRSAGSLRVSDQRA